MTRGTFVYRDGELVEKHLAAPLRPHGPASDLPSPYLSLDTIAPLKGMHDGRLYDSKSALRRSYRQHGVRELGNDAPKPDQASRPAKPEVTKDEVGAALAKVKSGYKPEIPPDTGL